MDEATSPSPRVRRRLRITGRVQGVWYRGSTRETARRLGLDGWVRNLDDGSVEAVAEGSEAAVERLVAWCHDGPPLARVERVTVCEEPVRGEERFEIR
ncbi:MAG: acylphosphatase [Planctomycetota bacterium JB042]